MLALVAVFVFGPDRLPEVARQAAKLLKSARTTIAAARAQVADELGPEYANLDLRDLNPKALVQKHLLGRRRGRQYADDTPARALATARWSRATRLRSTSRRPSAGRPRQAGTGRCRSAWSPRSSGAPRCAGSARSATRPSAPGRSVTTVNSLSPDCHTATIGSP